MNGKRRLRTIEPADLFRLKFLHGAQLAPDGKTIAYTVSHIDSDKEEEYVNLWLLSLETGVSHRLTSGLKRHLNPRWSPDSTQIAFLSSCNGKPQIYLIPSCGGEARALTCMEQGVGSGPVWSSDGKHIAFTARPAVEPSDQKKPYRVTRHIYRVDGMGYVDNKVEDIYMVPLSGGKPKRLTSDSSHNSEPQWSPDGKEILYSMTLAPDSHQAFFSRLRVVNLNGEVREIVGDWGSAGPAAWMPDGERIVFIGAPHDRVCGSKNDLWVVNKRNGEPECRSTGLRFGVGGNLQSDMPGVSKAGGILVTEDGKTACVQVQDGGTIQIYRIALTGTESCISVAAGTRSCILLDMVQGRLLFAVSTLDNPGDLFIAESDGSHERQLTHLNADLLTERALPPVEHLWFDGADGVQVEGWILKPCSCQAPYPTILYNHGGPCTGFGHIFNFDFQMLAGAGYAVLFINYRGSSGYGDEFGTQHLGDWGNLNYKDLMAGVEFAINKGIADPDRLGCCGLSYGGYLTCWITGQTDRFKAAAAENPITNLISFYGVSDIGPWGMVQEFDKLPHEIPEVYLRCSPITFANRCRTPVLLMVGEADYRCPAEQAEQFYTILKASNCVVEMLRFPGSSHMGSVSGPLIVRRVQNEALLDWMNRYVLGIKPDEQRNRMKKNIT